MSENEKRLRRWIEALVPSGKSKGFELLDALLSEHEEKLAAARRDAEEAREACRTACIERDMSNEAIRAEVLEEAARIVDCRCGREPGMYWMNCTANEAAAIRSLATAPPSKSEREMVREDTSGCCYGVPGGCANHKAKP